MVHPQPLDYGDDPRQLVVEFGLRCPGVQVLLRRSAKLLQLFRGGFRCLPELVPGAGRGLVQTCERFGQRYPIVNALLAA